MNYKVIFSVLILFAVLIVGMSAGFAANVTYTKYGNGVYEYQTSDNEQIVGYCLEYTKSSPSSGIKYELNTDTSSMDNRLKEIVVKNYRGNTAEQLNTNVAIREAVWNITNNRQLTPNTLSYNISKDVTGTMNIGDTYQFNDGVYIHNFNFYLGHATTNTNYYQQMLMFDYFATLIPVITPELPEIPETPETPETPVSPDTPTDDTPVVVDNVDNGSDTPITPETPAEETPETVDNNPNNNLPQSPAEPVTPDTPDTPETVTPSAPGPSETVTPVAEAEAAVAHAGTAMKKTGLPLLPALLVLIASFAGIGLRRKD